MLLLEAERRKLTTVLSYKYDLRLTVNYPGELPRYELYEVRRGKFDLIFIESN